VRIFLKQPIYDFDCMEPYSEGLSAITIYEKVGFIDKEGNIAIRPRFDGVEYGFSEELAPVRFDIDDS
jgi:hypothetical protein